MKKPPDGLVPGFGNNGNRGKKSKVVDQHQMTSAIAKYIGLQKQQLLDISLIELEGKIPANDVLMSQACIHKRGPADELVVWRGKPLIWFGAITMQEDEDGKTYPSIEFKFMYNVSEPPSDEPTS